MTFSKKSFFAKPNSKTGLQASNGLLNTNVKGNIQLYKVNCGYYCTAPYCL